MKTSDIISSDVDLILQKFNNVPDRDPCTTRCELVRYFSVFIGPAAVQSEFFKHFSVLVRCGPKISEIVWFHAILGPTGSGAWIPGSRFVRQTSHWLFGYEIGDLFIISIARKSDRIWSIKRNMH